MKLEDLLLEKIDEDSDKDIKPHVIIYSKDEKHIAHGETEDVYDMLGDFFLASKVVETIEGVDPITLIRLDFKLGGSK